MFKFMAKFEMIEAAAVAVRPVVDMPEPPVALEAADER